MYSESLSLTTTNRAFDIPNYHNKSLLMTLDEGEKINS